MYEYCAATLWSAQIMEREVYYYPATATDILQQSSVLAGISAILSLWHSILSNMANATANVRKMIKVIKNLIQRLLFLMQWVASYGEVTLLFAEDLSVFVCLRNRFRPLQHHKIDDIDTEYCYSFLGLTRYELRHLFVHWRIPETFQDSHTMFSKERNASSSPYSTWSRECHLQRWPVTCSAGIHDICQPCFSNHQPIVRHVLLQNIWHKLRAVDPYARSFMPSPDSQYSNAEDVDGKDLCQRGVHLPSVRLRHLQNLFLA